jgi:hypothetical protein
MEGFMTQAVVIAAVLLVLLIVGLVVAPHLADALTLRLP